jgi:peptide/nickel transport system substrate-binding protein
MAGDEGRISRIRNRVFCVLAGALIAGSAWGAIPAPAAEEPVRGGTFVVALGANPAHLNTSITAGVPVSLTALTVTEGLVRVGKDYLPKPELATSWVVSDAGKVITFKLRQGVKWHDGKPFTSADVKYSFDTLAPLHSRAASVFANVTSVAAPDANTIVITLKRAYGPFVDFLTADNAGIQPKHLYEGTEPLKNPNNLKPVGTGPFKFQSWQPGQSITFVRNPDYWDTGKPYLDRVIFQIMPDANSRVLALESGDIDYITNYDMGVSDVARLEKVKGISIGTDRGVARPLLLIYNTKQPQLADARVRKALLEATDRKIMLANAFAGLGKPGVSSISPSLAWAYNPAIDYMKMYPYDIARASKELDAAGYARKADGSRFTLRFTYDASISGFTEAAEVVRDNWKKVGVDVVLEPRERNVWIDAVFTKKEFDATISIYNSIGDPALGIDRAYRCDAIRKTGFTNGSQYCNPELDTLLDEGAAAYEKTERAKFYAQSQRIIAKDLPTAVLLDLGYSDAISTRFGNLPAFFGDRGDLNLRFAEIYRRKK